MKNRFLENWFGYSLGFLIFLFISNYYSSGGSRFIPERFSSIGQGIVSAIIDSVITGLVFASMLALYRNWKNKKKK